MTDLESACGGTPCHHPGFTCFKTFQPIHYDRRWFRQALVLAALDRSVIRMGPCPVQLDRLPVGTDFAFWAQTQASSQLVLISTEPIDDRDLRLGIPTLVLNRFDLNRQRAAAFAKAIWACKRVVVTHPEQYALVRIVLRQSSGIQLEKLVERAQEELGGDIDARIRGIYALIATGFLETDIGRGMRPDTIVYPGPLLAEDWRRPPTLALQDGGQLELFAPTWR